MNEEKQKFLDKMHPPKAEEQVIPYKKWMFYLFLCAIPVVNIIFLLVFATSKDPSMKTMKNFSKAALTWFIIEIILFGGMIIFWSTCIGVSLI